MIQVRVPPYFLAPEEVGVGELTEVTGLVGGGAEGVTAVVTGAAAVVVVPSAVVAAEVVAAGVVEVPELQPVTMKALTNRIARGMSSFFNLSSYKYFLEFNQAEFNQSQSAVLGSKVVGRRPMILKKV